MSFSDPIDALLDVAHALPACAVPASVLAFQRKRILDNLGCIAAGYQQAGTEAALQLARQWSGVEQATVLGSRERLSAPQAAFINAVRARALDYCDVISPGWHPSSSDIPVALAMAEHCASSGEEMLAALAIAQDIGQRINLASQANGFFYRGFDSNVLGLISAAIIAARLLKLDRQAFADAVGLAFDSGIGTFQHYQDKVLAVRIGQGMVARHGIEAALLAQAGISGPRRVLGGENGFFRLYAPAAPDLERLNTETGVQFLGEEATCFKLYPHCSILLALGDTLLAQPELSNHQLQNCRLQLRVSPTLRMVCGGPFEPGATAEIDAQFSARYVTANALLRRRASPAEFNVQAVMDPEVRRLANVIELTEEPAFERFDQCHLTLTAPGMAPRLLSMAYGRGWPENPLGIDEIKHKFMTCCALSGAEGFVQHASSIIEKVEKLKATASVTQWISTLLEG